MQGGREKDSLLCDVFESLLGALFLDGGFDAAKAWVLGVLSDKWPLEPSSTRRKDYKSKLQEETQRLFHELPKYTLLGSTGPEHDKCFEVSLLLPNGRCVNSTGGSVKRAEQTVAIRALEMPAGEVQG